LWFTPDATGTRITSRVEETLNQRPARALPAAAADVNAKTVDGATRLITASQNGDLDVVQALLAASADVNSKRGDGVTALFMASQQDHLEVVRALLAARAERQGRQWLHGVDDCRAAGPSGGGAGLA